MEGLMAIDHVRLLIEKIYIYPRLLRFKKKGGLSQAHCLSKLERKGREESHRRLVGVAVRWGLAGLEFGKAGQ
jgi:hypothetical protein